MGPECRRTVACGLLLGAALAISPAAQRRPGAAAVSHARDRPGAPLADARAGTVRRRDRRRRPDGGGARRPDLPQRPYITSYDAGRGQRFHLFGTSARFADMVRYYSVVLRERGRRVYDAPPIHQFETARFRDREMDYRPSVTIKDYTWNGAAGYINTTPGGDPAAFPTIIQITTLPEGAANR